MYPREPTRLNLACTLPCLSRLERWQALPVEVAPNGSGVKEQRGCKVLRLQRGFAPRTLELKAEVLVRRPAIRCV